MVSAAARRFDLASVGLGGALVAVGLSSFLLLAPAGSCDGLGCALVPSPVGVVGGIALLVVALVIVLPAWERLRARGARHHHGRTVRPAGRAQAVTAIVGGSFAVLVGVVSALPGSPAPLVGYGFAVVLVGAGLIVVGVLRLGRFRSR